MKPTPPPRPTLLAVLASAFALVALTWSLPTCSLVKPALAPPEVRVLLAKERPSLELSADGPYEVYDGRGKLVARGERMGRGVLRGTRHGQIELNGVVCTGPTLQLRPLSGTRFQFADTDYPGDLLVLQSTTNELSVQNVLDLETYVAGVLLSEMPSYFPREALLAQSIAARSYALWQLQNGQSHLLATQSHQVYGGTGPRQSLAREIVQSTRGQILESQGKPFCAFFSSTCGGATGDVHRVYSGAPQPPLTGVACDHCKDSSLYRWQRELSLSEIGRRLAVPRGSVENVYLQRDRFGRPSRMRWTGKGWEKQLSALDFRYTWNREAAKDEQLPSAFFRELDWKDGVLVVDGAGFGHGVGMCQYGAAGLAKAGHSYQQILQYYYQGAQTVRRW